MSSIISQESRVMLAQLLLSSKDVTRVWLRAEMDRLVDPLLDALFYRLETKLTNGLERTQSGGGDCAHVGNPTEHDQLPNGQLYQASLLIPQTSTSTLNPKSNHQPTSIDYEPENDPEILAEVKREIEEEKQMQLNMHNKQIDNLQIGLQMDGEQSNNCPQAPFDQVHHHQLQVNSITTEYTHNSELTNEMDNANTARIDSDEPEVKEEFDESSTELCNANQFLVQSTKEENKGTSNEQMSPDLAHCQSFLPPPNVQVQLDSIFNPQLSKSQPMTIKEEPGTDANETISASHAKSYSFAPWCNDAHGELTNSSTNDPNAQSSQSDALNEMLQPSTSTANNPMAECHFLQTWPASIFNKQSNQNLTNHDDESEGDDECECGDCVNDGIERLMNEDEGDSVDWFEDNIELEQSSREEDHHPVKRARLDTTQPNNAQTEVVGESLGQATQPNQVNNQKRQIIILSLQCLQSDCLDTFTGDKPVKQLNDHMREKHDIGQYRCAVTNCAQAFDNHFILSYHIKNTHQHTTKWQCGKCPRVFKKYTRLSDHNTEYHHLGQFHCSFPHCKFTRESRSKLYKHYSKQHKDKPILNCQYFGCNYQTSNANLLLRHKHALSSIKPYRCKWTGCDYAATQKDHVIDHIRRMHFAPIPNSFPDGTQLDPEDYVEVVSMLLESCQQPTQLDQVNKPNRQFITVHLQCPLSECPDTFTEEQLNHHMFDVHLIGPFRCLVKDCTQAFDNGCILGDHIKEVHHHTQWNCDKCSKYFPTYKLLSIHNFQYHQLGLFQCSFPACTFTGEYKQKVYRHYAKMHKPKLKELTPNSPYSGCNVQTYNQCVVNAHQRSHSGTRQYRCKLTGCDYSSKARASAVTHIRRKHFLLNPGSPLNEEYGDPSDYFELVQELL